MCWTEQHRLGNGTVSHRELVCCLWKRAQRAASCGPEDKACCLSPSLKNSHIWSPYDLDEAAASPFIFLFLEIEAHSQTQNDGH